jgi:hypothetical protein
LQTNTKVFDFRICENLNAMAAKKSGGDTRTRMLLADEFAIIDRTTAARRATID